MTAISPPGQPAVPGPADGPPPPAGRVPWRQAGIGLTSIGTPVGIGITDPLLAVIVTATELAIALTIVGTALFSTQDLSDRAFRLLRWIAGRPEPPGPAAEALRGQVQLPWSPRGRRNRAPSRPHRRCA